MIRINRSPAARGFSLIELMVAMALLSVFMIMTMIVSRSALDLHGTTLARIVAERNSAAFMRQLEADISQRVNRLEARMNIEKQVGDDGIALLTQRQGYAVSGIAADRRASLVSYRINRHALERAAAGYGFGSGQQRPDGQAGTLALARIPTDGPPEPEDKTFQVIAPAIIRMELAFVVRERNEMVVRADPPKDQQQILQVVATIAVLDPDRSRMLGEADFKLLASAFPDSRDGVLPITEWAEIASSLTRRLPNLPSPALQQVRVYQGVFDFPSSNSLP